MESVAIPRQLALMLLRKFVRMHKRSIMLMPRLPNGEFAASGTSQLFEDLRENRKLIRSIAAWLEIPPIKLEDIDEDYAEIQF